MAAVYAELTQCCDSSVSNGIGRNLGNECRIITELGEGSSYICLSTAVVDLEVGCLGKTLLSRW